MTHQHHDRACHLNGCDRDQTVPVDCPLCEQVIGHAPTGGMAQQSATWDKFQAHIGGVTMADSVSVLDLNCPRCTEAISVGVFISNVEPVPHAVQVTLSAETLDHICADLRPSIAEETSDQSDSR